MDAPDNSAVFDQLQFRARVRVAWAFFWRAIVITLASTLGGGIAGFVVGALAGIVAALLGYSTSSDGFRHTGQLLGGIAGGVVGVILFWQYIRWLFRARLGGYRLRLVLEVQDAV